MLQSLWTDADARAFLDAFAGECGEDVALRVYTSRLIGRSQDLVLHGGGNTSVKTTARDLLGEEVPVLAVKGSGWDLADLEPPGLPLVELAPLRRLLELDALTDEQMVNEVRRRLLDAGAPNPSVETLLHAALPHKFVDHTHADAILVLTNQPDGAAMVREVLGDRVAVLPWIMPGFPLAKAVAAAYEQSPGVEGVVLLQHGIFTFGDDARQSYERMIDLCATAERFIAARCKGKPTMTTPRSLQAEVGKAMRHVLPVVRGALALPRGGGAFTRFLGCWRHDGGLRAFSEHPACRRLVELGPLTPDHVIRTKGRYLYLTRQEAEDPELCRARVAGYAGIYRDWFTANAARAARPLTMLDPHPRVVVVEGLGILAFGETKRAAEIAADIAEHTLHGKSRGEAIGCYTELSPDVLFEMEYWSLEQAKLGKQQPRELQGQVALVTGAAGAIGQGVCEALARAGAVVVVVDVDEQAAKAAAARLGAAVRGVFHPVRADVTDPHAVEVAFATACVEFGGVDIVVANAGIAHVGPLATMDVADFRRVVDVNLTGTLTVLREAARVFADQRTGGSVIVQASKNVFAPGADFGAYSASKAGQHQLGKVAALELAALGVRVNMIHADAVFGDAVPSGLWAAVGPSRMKSRGLDPAGLREFYRERSLLKLEVTPAHVGDAVVFLASERAAATTGTTLTVDGGVPGAFPR